MGKNRAGGDRSTEPANDVPLILAVGRFQDADVAEIRPAPPEPRHARVVFLRRHRAGPPTSAYTVKVSAMNHVSAATMRTAPRTARRATTSCGREHMATPRFLVRSTVERDIGLCLQGWEDPTLAPHGGGVASRSMRARTWIFALVGAVLFGAATFSYGLILFPNGLDWLTMQQFAFGLVAFGTTTGALLRLVAGFGFLRRESAV